MSPVNLASTSDHHLDGSQPGICSSCSKKHRVKILFVHSPVTQALSSNKGNQGQGLASAVAGDMLEEWSPQLYLMVVLLWASKFETEEALFLSLYYWIQGAGIFHCWIFFSMKLLVETVDETLVLTLVCQSTFIPFFNKIHCLHKNWDLCCHT